MPLIDINNPDVIKFLVENYEKTNRLRMTWNANNEDMVHKAATLNREAKGYYKEDVCEASMTAGMLSLTRDNKSSARNRRLKALNDGVHVPGVADMRKGHSIIDVGLGDPKDDPRLARPDTDLTIDPIMRPVDPIQKIILYKRKPDYGRQVYLTQRSKSTVPEKRYYFAEKSSWVYGWRLRDSYFKATAPEHGCVWRLYREKCRSGPQPDPIHYSKLASGPTKFS